MRKLFTVLLLIVSCLTPYIIYAENETDAEPEYSALEQEIFGLLDALGIYTKDDEKIDEPIMRGEFTEYALKLIGMTQIEINQSDAPLRFPDVVNSSYRAAVSYAADKGYVAGYSDGYFYPDNYITLNEAARVINNILGYNVSEQYSLSNNELLKNIGYTDGNKVSRRMMAKLFYNALNSKVITMDITDSVNYNYGETALYKFFKTECIKGIVDTNEITSLDNIDGCYDGCIKINGIIYNDPSNITRDFLGYSIKAYCRENDDEDDIIFAVEDNNNVLTVKAEDILPNTTDKSFVYDIGGREKKFDISPVISVIYNNTCAIRYDEDLLKPKNGEVIFIDNNRDSKYDVVKIFEYYDYYVSGTDVEKGIIYDAYGKNPVLTEDKKLEIVKNSKKASLEDIYAGNVVSVYSSDKYVKIDISTLEISGTVKSLSADSESQTIMIIGSTQYYVSLDYLTAASAGKASIIRVGESGKFYLNSFGKVVAYVRQSGGDEYGFLLRIYSENDDDTYNVVIIGSDGIKKVYALAEKTKIYIGNNMTRLDKLNHEVLLSTAEKQLVKFISDKDKITSLFISDGYIFEDYVSDNTKQLSMNANISKGSFHKESGTINGEWMCGSQTIIFSVPRDSTTGEINTDKIKVYDYQDIINYNYDMEIYDSGKNKIPAAVVMYNGNIRNDANVYNDYKNFNVVVKEYITYNEEKNVSETVVECYKQGKLVTYTSEDEDVFKNFEKGDIAQIAILDNEVVATRVFFKNKDIDLDNYKDKRITYRNTFQKRNVWNFGYSTNDDIYTSKSSESMLVHAKVLDYSSEYVSVQYPSDAMDTAITGYKETTVLTYPIKSWTKIYKVKNGKDITVESAGINDLRASMVYGSYSGSEVVMNVRASRIDEIFIFEN